ncbi:flagellum-specific ATP synthase [Motilibacter rhizosphaerae]|uniref:Flagellum-specific ATP synthase n=1 Tax=Motilibacter rhizosphaerae TaxID=598652 RepID=A0A4V2F533_9ACTN|nr:FliI/YscN family ATPase [Motilibacter rhizosphaerae]RZS91419.1 flagellum-specific ATP synthase [Motilibacter rhizosphaerae]
MTLLAPSRLAPLFGAAAAAATPTRTGRVARVVGLEVGVGGVDAAVGDVLEIATGGPEPLQAEVVALGDGTLSCTPLGPMTGIRVGAPVVATGGPLRVPVGPQLLGRVLDGLGRPLDGGPDLDGLPTAVVDGVAPHPLLRARVDRPVSLGVRAVDTMTPIGRGQRMGIFAGSGVGKSSLLSMIARGTEAQVSVVALVGERGREVREFLENDLGPEGLARSVVVIATSDQPPMVRLRAAFVATRIAEEFRDAGADVVLMMDSLTRVAMAQREVGLSSGEPPTTKGYPPSTFALLPRLLERAGPGERGSITGLYTVLVDGDDHNEPIADAARSILDGHLVLTRRLATAGHFPSIDVLDSISRVAGAVTTPQQKAAAGELRRLLAAYRDAKDLIEIGAYAAGTNPDVDRAVALMPHADAFLRQAMHDVTPAPLAWEQLQALVTGG